MSSKSTAGGHGSDQIYSTISGRQASMLNLSTGTRSQTPVAPVSTSAPHVFASRRPVTKAAHAGGGGLASAAFPSGHLTSWNAASPIHDSTTVTIATDMAALQVVIPKLPTMAASTGDNLNPSLPSTIFVSPEQLEEFEKFTSTPTLGQGNAMDTSHDSVAIEGPVIISIPTNPLLTGHQTGGTTRTIFYPKQQATVFGTTYENSQHTELKMATDSSEVEYSDDQSHEDFPAKRPRKRMTRASTESRSDPNDKEAIRKYKNRLAAKKCREGKDKRIKELKEELEKLNKDLAEKEGHRDTLQANVDRQRKDIEKHRKAGCTFPNLSQ